MPRKIVNPTDISPPLGAYSHGVTFTIGDTRLLFSTGQAAIGLNGDVVSDDLETQTHFVFENIQKILSAEGMSFIDIVKVQIFTTEMQEYEKISRIRNQYLKASRPASTMVEVKSLPKDGCKIEVEVIAAKSG